MKTYTEQQIKDWFDAMIKKYPNSNFEQYLISVKNHMFSNDDLTRRNNLENFLKNHLTD